MKRETTESFLSRLLPILAGLFIAAIIILIVKSPYPGGSEFWTNTMIAAVILGGIALTVLLVPNKVRIGKQDLDVWQKFEKRSWSLYILQETVGQPISFLFTILIGGIFLVRDYLKEQSPIDHIALYLMPSLMVVIVNLVTSVKVRKAMEKAIERKKFTI